MFAVGKSTIRKVHELDLNDFELTRLFPSMDEHLAERHPDWLPSGTTRNGFALLSVHAWLVRHEGLTVLIDTGAGNDKARPQQQMLDHLHNPFLDRLADAGVTPESVDYVLHTHLHADHVGWNTRLLQGEWVPTFPNATHVCSKVEWEYSKALADGDEERIASIRNVAGLGQPIRIPVSGTFADSLQPLQATGQIRLIEVNGSDFLPGIRFVPSPGHSIDHASIELESDGQLAIFAGDAMHHPVELHDLDLVSVFCEFPEATRHSRRKLLTRAAESHALCFTAHFPLGSAGTVQRDGDVFSWEFK